MGTMYYSPTWFFGYDVFFELLFAIVTGLVAYQAYRMYKMTDQRQIRLFGISFTLISLSYLIQSIFNFMILSELNENVCGAMNVPSVALFDTVGLYAHMIFKISGIVLLGFMTFKLNKDRVYWLLWVTTVLAIIMSINTIYIFHLMATIYLIAITWFFFENYKKKKEFKRSIIVVAFFFLLLAHLQFALAVNNTLYYVVGHLLEFIAYVLISWNLLLVHKK